MKQKLWNLGKTAWAIIGLILLFMISFWFIQVILTGTLVVIVLFVILGMVIFLFLLYLLITFIFLLIKWIIGVW